MTMPEGFSGMAGSRLSAETSALMSDRRTWSATHDRRSVLSNPIIQTLASTRVALVSGDQAAWFLEQPGHSPQTKRAASRMQRRL